MTKCCANCFDDRGLRVSIIPMRSSGSGKCSYCETESVTLVEPKELNEYFSLVTAIYRPGNNGKTLVEWLREDWSLFTHPKMDDAHAKELLADILDDGEIVRKKFSPSELCNTDSMESWSRLKNELMYENRFFPENDLNEERFEELLQRLELNSTDISAKWYRARIQPDESTFSLDEMGAPPRRISSHGRANPAGIPYLYLGSIPNTAVAEIRPHAGELASVAKFNLNSDLRIVDLKNPRGLVSPFLLSDENEIALLRGDIEFLEHLGNELTRPVLPRAAAIDYIPSQYVCEFIKKCGYDGVIYKSSVSEGINFALFQPEKATPITVETHNVTSVKVEVERYLSG